LGGAQFKAQVEAKLRIKLETGKVGRPEDPTQIGSDPFFTRGAWKTAKPLSIVV
jgi:hypothetical protein